MAKINSNKDQFYMTKHKYHILLKLNSYKDHIWLKINSFRYMPNNKPEYFETSLIYIYIFSCL